MSTHPTPTPASSASDPVLPLLSILEIAAAQDGTLLTAQHTLRSIEDLALAAIRKTRCRHDATALADDLQVCTGCGAILDEQ